MAKRKTIFSLEITKSKDKFHTDYVIDGKNDDMYFILQELNRQMQSILKMGNKQVKKRKRK